MKTKLTILLLLATIFSYSQRNDDQRFTFSMYTDVMQFYHGINIGAEIEYQMSYVYFKYLVGVIPDYESLSYFYHGGVAGYNFQNMWEEYRVYAGMRVELVRMDGQPYVNYGPELGYDYYFKNTSFYIGAQAAYLFKNDRMHWEHVEGHKYYGKEHYSELSLSLKLGVQF